jgi:hypothetical protein
VDWIKILLAVLVCIMGGISAIAALYEAFQFSKSIWRKKK